MEPSMIYEVITFAERPAPEEDVTRIIDQGWPRFMLFDPVADRYWTRLHTYFPQYQLALYDDDMNVIAIGNSVPFRWDGRDESLSPRGWDWVMETAVQGYEAGDTPNALSAISITVARSHIGRGVSGQVVRAMRRVARDGGLKAMVAPVRPNLKSLYPLTPMERYILWKTAEGTPFDPWLRGHFKAGARIVKVCPQSMNIPGSVDQWEEWASMIFPESGQYVVPGALNPVEINVEDDLGLYIEPNIWVVHDLS